MFNIVLIFRRRRAGGAESPPAPGEPWIVLDSAGNDYTVFNPVKSSDGTNYNAVDPVLASDGTSYTPI